MAVRRPLEGKASFLKKRTIEYTKDGVEMGLNPVSYNPVDLTLLKIREMNKYIAAHQTLNELKTEGLTKFFELGDKPPEGWEQINDKISTVYSRGPNGEVILRRGHYYAQPDSARIINNYLSPGLQKSAIYQGIQTTTTGSKLKPLDKSRSKEQSTAP